MHDRANPERIQLTSRLQEVVRQIRRRRHVRALVHGALGGVFWGSIVALPLLALRLVGLPVANLSALAAGLVCVLAGIWSKRRRESVSTTAMLIDQQCHLEDRVLTALDASNHPSLSAMESLQLRDAVQRVNAIRPSQVVPHLMPTHWKRAALAPLAATVLLGLSNWQQPGAKASVPDPGVSALAGTINNEVLKDVRELANSSDFESELDGGSLQSVSQQIELLAKQLSAPGSSERDVLRVLAQMEIAIEHARNTVTPAGLPSALQILAKAFERLPALHEVGRALRRSELSTAATLLRDCDVSDIDVESKRRLKKELARMASTLRERDFTELASAIEQLESEVHGEPVAKRAQALVRLLEHFAAQAAIRAEMHAQLETIAEARAEFTNPGTGGASLVAGNQSGKQVLATPGRNDPQEISGERGAGPSKLRTQVAAPNGNEFPGQTVGANAGQNNQRQDTTPAIRESLPLSHRLLIRRYFQTSNSASASRSPPAVGDDAGTQPRLNDEKSSR